MKFFIFTCLLISSSAFAKNKILYKTCVNCPVKEKEVPLYDLAVQTDFKTPGTVTLESRLKDIDHYGSSEDFVAYIKKENNDNILYVVTDFKTFTKRRIADHVTKIAIRNGLLFFERAEPSGNDKFVNVLYYISDFKAAQKVEVHRGYGTFEVDNY